MADRLSDGQVDVIGKKKGVKKEGLEFIKFGKYLCIRHGHHTIDIFLGGYFLIDDIDGIVSAEGNIFTVFLDDPETFILMPVGTPQILSAENSREYMGEQVYTDEFECTCIFTVY